MFLFLLIVESYDVDGNGKLDKKEFTDLLSIDILERFHIFFKSDNVDEAMLEKWKKIMENQSEEDEENPIVAVDDVTDKSNQMQLQAMLKRSWQKSKFSFKKI